MNKCLLILLIISQLTWAEMKVQPALPQASCPIVDLSDRLDPPYDQSFLAICWDSAATDLLNFHNGLKGKDSISRIDVAATAWTAKKSDLKSIAGNNFNLYRGLTEVIWPTFVDPQQRLYAGKGISEMENAGGTVEAAISAYNASSGLCKEVHVPSQNSPAFKDRGRTLQFGVLGDVNYSTFDNKIYQLINPEAADMSDDDSKAIEKEFSVGKIPAFNCRHKSLLMQSLNDSSDIENVYMRQRLKTALDKACAPRSAMKPAIPMVLIPGSNASSASIATTGLLQNHIPVAIQGSFPCAENESGRCSHAMVVVGVTPNSSNTDCVYKIRNSWSSACDPNIEIPHIKCENGYLTMTGRQLNDFVVNMVYIMPQTPRFQIPISN